MKKVILALLIMMTVLFPFSEDDMPPGYTIDELPEDMKNMGFEGFSFASDDYCVQGMVIQNLPFLEDVLSSASGMDVECYDTFVNNVKVKECYVIDDDYEHENIKMYSIPAGDKQILLMCNEEVCDCEYKVEQFVDRIPKNKPCCCSTAIILLTIGIASFVLRKE